MALLSKLQKADFLYLLRQSGLTKGNLFTHLARLEACGYIEIDKGFRGKMPITLVGLTAQGN